MKLCTAWQWKVKVKDFTLFMQLACYTVPVALGTRVRVLFGRWIFLNIAHPGGRKYNRETLHSKRSMPAELCHGPQGHVSEVYLKHFSPAVDKSWKILISSTRAQIVQYTVPQAESEIYFEKLWRKPGLCCLRHKMLSLSKRSFSDILRKFYINRKYN